MGNEHRMVQNTGSTCELCFFNDNTYSINDSTNKFCLTMAGSQRFGFEWKKRSQDYSKANNEGYIEVDFNLYSKQALQLEPQFKIDRLIENNMSWKMDEFAIQA